MIVFTVDDNGLIKTIADQLGEYHSKAPTVLKQALNATAKDARTMLATQAQEVYVIQKSRFNKAMEFGSKDKATLKKLEATIRAKGTSLELLDFKTVPKKPTTGDARPDITTGKVLKSSGMKRLEVGGIKAFVAQFRSGHVSIVQRRGAERLPVRKLLSPSIPKMVGNEKTVYGEVKPQIAELLDANIRKYIDKTISKGAKA